MQIERKVCEAPELKVLGDDSGPGRIVGYASTYTNFDRVGEKVMPDAFVNLDEFKRDGYIALEHDWTKRVCTIDVAENRRDGLWVEADFHSTPDAQVERTKARERLDRGKSVSLSIGYKVLDAEPTKDGRLLKSLHLYEVSIVSVPANPLATIQGVKSYGLDDGLLTYSENLEAVVDAAEKFLERTRARAELREKAGRRFSAESRGRLADWRSRMADITAELDDILSETEPKADPDEVRKAVARLAALQAQMDQRYSISAT